MNSFLPEDIERVNKQKETNDKLETFFLNKREDWTSKLNPLFEVVNLEPSRETSSRIIETQSLCLSYRQIINEQISLFLEKRTKTDVKIKKLKHDKFIWYATGFGIKTNMGEKTVLIEAQAAEEQRNMELIENYVEFLRTSLKNLESLQYTIKNIIELFNYLSR